MEKKFHPKGEKKQMTKEAKRRFWFILGTALLLLVTAIVTLSVCWIYFKWEWSSVAWWLNPFSPGNTITWAVYAGLLALGMLVVWLLHRARMDKGV